MQFLRLIMKEKGPVFNMLVLMYLMLFLDKYVMAQTEFAISTELPADGSMPREGDTAYVLKCNIQAVNVSTNATYTYIWTKDDTVLSIGQQNFSERFSISQSSDMGKDVYQITISTIEIADSGLYTCVIINDTLELGTPASVDVIRNGMLASASEMISVRYFPSENPTCSVNVNGPIEDGRVVTLTCMSAEGNPDVTLRWGGLPEGQITKSGSTITLEQNVGISSEMDGTSFNCSMTSLDSFPGEERTCSIGPITVTPGSGFVTVSLRSPPLSLQGNFEEFQCTPAAQSSIRWFTQPEVNANRITKMGNDVYRILDLRMSDIGTRVFCEATRNSDGAIYRGYFEIQLPTTIESIPTTRTTTLFTGTTIQPRRSTPSRTSVISTMLTTTLTKTSAGKQEGIDILLVAVVSGAMGFVLLLVLAFVIACCCCCRRHPSPKKPKQTSEYDWEGHPPSHARTASLRPPSPVPDRGPDPIVVRNPTHGAAPAPAPQSSQTPQTELLVTPPDLAGQQGISPSLLFAMKNLVDEEDDSDEERPLEDDRLKIPRAVAREPPNARGKKLKEKDIASGSFVSRGHPLKRTPLSSLERGGENEPMYSSSERPNQRTSRDPTYAPLNDPFSHQRASHIPPDVTVTEDPSKMYAKVDRSSSGFQMPDLTVGVADRSPIVNASPENTSVPKKKKLPAGARAAIGPAASKAFTNQQDSQTTRLSSEISTQDIVPTVSENNPPSQPLLGAPNVAPPTYEDVSRLKAQGLINSGFQLGPTDTMIIHNTPGQSNKLPEQSNSNLAANSNTDEIKYF